MLPPALALRAFLDGGGENGALIADDEWHEARGVHTETPDCERMPKDIPLVAYVWLRPTEGWDIAHTTYIDRVEVLVSDAVDEGEPAPEAARRIAAKVLALVLPWNHGTSSSSLATLRSSHPATTRSSSGWWAARSSRPGR